MNDITRRWINYGTTDSCSSSISIREYTEYLAVISWAGSTHFGLYKIDAADGYIGTIFETTSQWTFSFSDRFYDGEIPMKYLIIVNSASARYSTYNLIALS